MEVSGVAKPLFVDKIVGQRGILRLHAVIALSVSALFISFKSQAQTTVNICDRTPQIETAILNQLPAGTDCMAVESTGLANINRIDVSRSNISSLKAGDFDGLTGLDWLDLDSNSLTSLHEDIFDGLNNLSQLLIRGNVLTSLPKDLFDGLTNLENLDLEHNALTSLHEDLFDGLTSLQWLFLDYNALTSLPEDLFDGLTNLNWLDLGDNPQMTSLPEDLFDGLSNLRQLELWDNALTSLPEDLFDGLTNLEELFLKRNALTSLPEDLFDGLTNLERLLLDHNTLTNLPEDLFDGLTELRILVLDNNPPLGSLHENLFDHIPPGPAIRLQLELHPPNRITCLPKSILNNSSIQITPNIYSACSITATLSLSPASIDESGGITTITATLDYPSSVETMITVSASPQAPATAADFDLSTNTTLAIAAGQTTSTGVVTITANDNHVKAPDKTITVQGTAANQQGVTDPADLTLTITDDDVASLTAPSAIVVIEGDSTSLSVALVTQPSGNVMVTVTGHIGTDLTPTPTALTFTQVNWSTAQSIALAAAEDLDLTDDRVTLTLTASGGGYVGVSHPVVVTISDNDKLAFSGTIPDQIYTQYRRITDLILPSATGGIAPLTYRLTPDLPNGLSFDATTLTISGTPTMVTAETIYTYAVTDAAGFVRSQDFSIMVEAQALALASIPDQTYSVDEEITPLQLPAAIGGQPPYDYNLSPDPPPGLIFDATFRTLSGLPVSVMEQTVYTYEVTDQEGSTASQIFSIAVTNSSALLGDRAALIALYKATDGPNWTNSTNWLDPPEEVVTFTAQQLDAWYGVSVSGGRVSSVELPVNNLQGILPSELGKLTALKQFELPNNGLHGTIPAELEHLRSLRQLHLQNNQLDGGVPEELGYLTALEQLWLFGNSLSGPIPSALGSLVNMIGLLLSDNEFTGTIPTGFGDLEYLQDLWLQGNQLSGAIPPELGQLDSLRTLLLNDNELSGEIPPVLGNLTNLRDLWLNSNDLTGAIPSELGQLDSLRGLLLNDNQLTDSIPSALGGLSTLQWLHLQENVLRGTIPQSLGQLTQLEQLQLSGNSLSGPLPHTLGQLTALEYLYVHENALTGPLPATLTDLGALKELFFDGPIQELCAPTHMEFSTWLATLASVRGPDCGAFTLSFESPVLAKSFLKGKGADMTLPAAEGGQAPYKYTLHPEPPAGLTFDAEQRTLAGTPVDAVANMEYTYAAVDNMGRKGKVNFTITVLPSETALLTVHSNYPNPFRESTNLNISLASDADISVEIFDLLGRLVLSQETRPMQAGRNQPWLISGLTAGSGIFLYRVRAATNQETQMRTGRMTVIK